MTQVESAPILIDTSVWIDAFLGRTPPVVAETRRLLEQDLALTCGPVLFEIRRGLRPADKRRILPLFEAMKRLVLEESDWEAAGDLDAALRGKGCTLPPMDIVIARLALRHGVGLYTLDRHFASVPGLRRHAPATSPQTP